MKNPTPFEKSISIYAATGVYPPPLTTPLEKLTIY
jgi:hypothetical protein